MSFPKFSFLGFCLLDGRLILTIYGKTDGSDRVVSPGAPQGWKDDSGPGAGLSIGKQLFI